MSQSHPTSLDLHWIGPRHAAQNTDDRYPRARRWTVGVLGVATLALGAWVALLYAGLTLVRPLIEAFRPGTTTGPDGSALALDALPALLVGWCIGLAVLAVVAQGKALGPRLAGLTAGAVGALAGALVLSAGPLL